MKNGGSFHSYVIRLPFRVAVHDERHPQTSPDRWFGATKWPEPLGLVLGGLVDLAFNWQFSFPRAPPMHIARYLLAGHRFEHRRMGMGNLGNVRSVFGQKLWVKKKGTPSSKMVFFFQIRMVGDLEDRPYFQTLIQMRFLSFFLQILFF